MEPCTICLDALPNPGQSIQRETRTTQYLAKVCPCGHKYHDFCIKAWADKANTCPQCRASFNSIELYAENKVISRIHVDDKLFPLEVDDTIPPEFVDETLPEFRHQHLERQPCCLCDTNSDGVFAICTECSSGYHLNCLGVSEATFQCPVCGVMQGPDAIVDNSANRQRSFMGELRRQIRSLRFDHMGVPRRRIPDDIDYVSLVERQREAAKEPAKEPDEAQVAWNVLDTLKQGHTCKLEQPEKKLKRPGQTRRTEEALSRSSSKLSYTQKLIIQRLLLRPKLKEMRLPSQVYTRVNRHISHRLYKAVQHKPTAMYWLNALEETAERDNINLQDKRQIDQLSAASFKAQFEHTVTRLLHDEFKV